MHKPVRIGVIGTGAISGAYFNYAKKFPILEMAACADLNIESAQAKAKEFGVPKVCSVDELLADPSIEIVLNLTIPKVHATICSRAALAGKHSYVEKPLGINREEGLKLVQIAKEKNVRVGCAPDTFMGAGIQTARKVIDDGLIGRPIAFTAFMIGRGHEHWHPNPEFYYQPGGGPMLDMGPYYVTALLNLLGSWRRAMGMASITQTERPITHKNREGGPGPKFGKIIKVEEADHIMGTIEFENGCVGTIIQSFAMRAGSGAASPIIVYGTEGTLHVPDPNGFDGPVKLCRFEDGKPDEFVEVPHAFPTGYGRAVGLADMAHAIRSDREDRCSAQQAMAVLDLMLAFKDSSDNGVAIAPSVTYTRPTPMANGLPFGQLD